MQIFCETDTDISNLKKELVLKDIFSKTEYVCVLTCHVSTF